MIRFENWPGVRASRYYAHDECYDVGGRPGQPVGHPHDHDIPASELCYFCNQLANTPYRQENES